MTVSHRADCNICGYHFDAKNGADLVTVRCNVRAFLGERFRVWRCPRCQTIHCYDIVDLDHYYSKYAFIDAKLTFPLRLAYRRLRGQLEKHGFNRSASFMDYGCGEKGLFIQYLRECGFTNCIGYDPHSPANPKPLNADGTNKTFDFVLVQDVIEHAEDPTAFLNDIDAFLHPGSHVLVGTPNAARIDLQRPEFPDFRNAIHVPYHLHIYTRDTLAALGRGQGWEAVETIERAYHDTYWPVLNPRTWNEYIRLFDGACDCVWEPIQVGKALTSSRAPHIVFYSLFGVLLSHRIDTAVVFRKPAAAAAHA